VKDKMPSLGWCSSIFVALFFFLFLYIYPEQCHLARWTKAWSCNTILKQYI
jgi:hypothetical protein